MQSTYSIPLSTVIQEFQLQVIESGKDLDEVKVSSTEITRPGLAMTGFLDVFEPFRIQIIGKAEHTYLASMSSTQRSIRLENFFQDEAVGSGGYQQPCHF